MRIYVASSWRNTQQPAIVETLRAAGHEVYDFKNPPNGSGFGWKQVDYDGAANIPSYLRALKHPRAIEGFESDMDALEGADATVLVLPCGRSAHLELGHANGLGQRTFVLLSEEKWEPELMYLMCERICTSIDEVAAALSVPPAVDRRRVKALEACAAATDGDATYAEQEADSFDQLIQKGKGTWPNNDYVRDSVWDGWLASRQTATRIARVLREKAQKLRDLASGKAAA